MRAYTIKELHEMFKENPSSIKAYYEDLFNELEKQQDRLNALVTVTKEEAMAKLEEASFDANDMF